MSNGIKQSNQLFSYRYKMRKSSNNPARADKERGKGEKKRKYGRLVKRNNNLRVYLSFNLSGTQLQS